MKVICLSNDHAFQHQLKVKAMQKEAVQYDKHLVAESEKPESAKQGEQADSQGPAQKDAPKEKKGKNKKVQEQSMQL